MKDASLCWRRSRSRDPAQWSRCKHSLTPFFIQPHIPVFISTQVFKPLCSRVLWQVQGGGCIAPTRVELNPPGSRAGLPPLLLLLAAPSSVQAASSSCRELPNTPGELQLRAATKSVRDFTPRRLSVEEVLLGPNLLFFVPSVLLSLLVKGPDIRVSFCAGLRFPYKAGGLGGGGSPRWESSAAGGSTEPFPGLSGQ